MKKKLKNYALIITLISFVALAGCKKDNSSTTTATPNDPSAQSAALSGNYQAASSFDTHLVTYHQHALSTGIHDSCNIYWRKFNQSDSLFSFNFYDYCRKIYANNGGKLYGMGGWNWNDCNGGWYNGNWQCGLDTLQFKTWRGFGDCYKHDSLMYNKIKNYGMMGHFSSQANQYYTNMQTLRNNHYKHHNYHW